MKHAIEAFLGYDSSENAHYELVCGARTRFAKGVDVVENEPINAGPGTGWCPNCFPEKAVAQLRDEDGGAVALHPELGELQQDGDGTTIAEDMGEETIMNEEIVEE